MRAIATDLCVLCVTLWSSGCAPGPLGTVGTDAPFPLADHVTVLVSHIDTVYEDTRGDAAWGFDLDGRTTLEPVGTTLMRCDGAMDYVDPYEGRTGVDDQFGTGLSAYLLDVRYQEDGTTLQDAIDAELARGAWLLAIDVDGIDGADDPQVGVTLRRVHATAPIVAAHGVLPPGLPITTDRFVGVAHGRIAQGRLSFELDALELPLGAHYPSVTLTGVHVSARLARSGLVDGEIGGAVAMDDLLALAQTGGGLALDRPTLESVVLPDLEPSEDGRSCNALSVGIGFEAAPARLSP